jgi:hypothetical protein
MEANKREWAAEVPNSKFQVQSSRFKVEGQEFLPADGREWDGSKVPSSKFQVPSGGAGEKQDGAHGEGFCPRMNADGAEAKVKVQRLKFKVVNGNRR